MQLIRNTKDDDGENDTFTLRLDSLEMMQLLRCCCITKRHQCDVLGLIAADVLAEHPNAVTFLKEQGTAFETDYIFDLIPVAYAVAHKTSSIEKVV